MEISKTSKITPNISLDVTRRDEYVWTQLVPRLVNPGALAIIKTLLQEGRPLSPVELAKVAELSTDYTRYQCESMDLLGVLGIVRFGPRPDGDGDEPFYDFPEPSRSAPSPSPSGSS